MGRVHLVRPAANYSEKHFMIDVEGDINEGQKVMKERSRRGPFRDQGGDSTVMDRSAHVVYRKRSGVFEITVRRGVSPAEFRTLRKKLEAHRLSTGGSRVTIIKGGKRFRLGFLSDLDMRHLLDLVSECLGSYGNCGLEITEKVGGSGALYKSGVHKSKFKAASRS